MSLEVKEGELLILLGPSGCGKTTTLRLVAGFLQPSGGEILIDGKLVGSPMRMVPPNLRNLAMVFQNYALWPHKTVFDNVAYGLRIRKTSKKEIKEKVERTLEIMRLKEYQKRFPQELSGGQQQRISLARAIVIEPSILLFDEPLSNLDAKLREEMRFELKDLQRRLGITSLYVTHDQEEALSIGDRIVVMNQGKIEQIGAPEEIYRKSSSKFVVSFVGLTNLIPARVFQINEDGTLIRVRSDHLGELLISSGFSFGGPLSVDEGILINIRPEDVKLLPKGNSSRRPNLFPGRVTSRSFLGSMIDYRIEVKGISFRIQAHPSLSFQIGEEVSVLLDPKVISWFKKD
jgi:iron(III) transport system ATP-binding protein